MPLFDIFYYIFVVATCFQVLYFLIVFSQFAFSKESHTTNDNQLPISVIICAKNEANNLKKFLPSIINQNYSNFEIVLINDSSNDNTLEIMELFAEKYSRINIVNVENNETFWASKKYALTLGIKASKNNNLLFSDADCQAMSPNWIYEMSAHFNQSKSIILGYGAYTKIKKSLLNKLIRFETLSTAMQYFSFAKIGMPYMGVGRNLAYTKETFFKANGFTKHMHIKSGDDDLFINSVSNANNTEICVSKDSFIISNPKLTFKEWIHQKKRHITTANNYKTNIKTFLALFYITQVLFYAFGALFIATLYNWPVIGYLIATRLLIQYIIMTSIAKKLDEKDLILLTPFWELFLIVFQFSIFISNLFSKPKHWK